MNEQVVLRADSEGVATLTLNRPEKLNALTQRVFEELRGHLEDIAGDESLGCVVLTGAGKSFCAGFDLAAASSGSKTADPGFAAETIDLLEALPQPTIGMIRGHCLTGGLELALGCDLLVCGEDSKIGDTHGRWGLVPVWGMSVRLPERVGRSTAKEMMFTGHTLNGPQAFGRGLVNRCVADSELESIVAAMAAAICTNSRGTNRIDKLLLASSRDQPRGDALRSERSRPFGIPSDARTRRDAF